MTSHLRAVLASAMNAPGVVAGVLFDHLGHAIDSASWVEGDVAAWSAAANELLRQWASVGSDLRVGGVRSVLIERQDGPVTITPMEDDAALLIVGNRSGRPGHLRLAARRARGLMSECDQVNSAPESSLPPDVPDHIGDPVTTTGEVRPSASSHLTTGEVILVGAHTFRLVTKLIAHLVQTKGVRSSTLRAYSPSSTVVDVVLENGATLETIDRSGLAEFSVERAEEAGARLVLRASRPLALAGPPMGNSG